MSTLPQRRALTLPVALARSQELPASPSELPELRIPSDDEAMRRLQTNDATALEILFDRYARLDFRIALGVVRDRGEAEDVVQECFFHLYRKCFLFDGAKGTVKNWVLQIALHRALDRRGHLARRGFYSGTDTGVLGDTLLGETDLEREIGAKLNRIQLEKAFDELPESQRITLELNKEEGV